MKKLLMSVAFIALVGSIVPADAGSTLAIGGGFNLGHVQTTTAAATHGTAAAGSLANGTNTNIGAGFAAVTPAGSIATGLGASAGQSNAKSGAVSFGNGAAMTAASPTTPVSVSAEASPTCCPNVDDSSMVANLRHHAADRWEGDVDPVEMQRERDLLAIEGSAQFRIQRGLGGTPNSNDCNGDDGHTCVLSCEESPLAG